MFRNRWGALLFVGITLAGVTALVGTERGEGAIQQATDQIAQQKAQADRLVADPQASSSAAGGATGAAVVFTAEEELIDPTIGEDPTPIDDFAAANPQPPEEIADEVVIVSRDVPGQPAQPQPPAPIVQ